MHFSVGFLPTVSPGTPDGAVESSAHMDEQRSPAADVFFSCCGILVFCRLM